VSPGFRPYFHEQRQPDTKTLPPSRAWPDPPDGLSISKEIRSEKLRPFTEEEDRALRAGYGGRGTIWAQIVKDSIIQEQRRLSVDLRDLLNTFPDLYEGARYDSRPVPRMEGTTVADSNFPSPQALPVGDPWSVERVVGPISPVFDDELPLAPVGLSKWKRTDTDERPSESAPQSPTGPDDGIPWSPPSDPPTVPVTTFLLVTHTQLLNLFQSSPRLYFRGRLSLAHDTKNEPQGSFLVFLFASVSPPGLVAMHR